MNNVLVAADIFSLAEQGELWAGHLIPDHSVNRELSFPTIAPHNKSVIGAIESGSPEIVNLAVSAAREGFNKGEWSNLNPAERKDVMYKWVTLLEKHAEELAALDCVEAGKPIAECLETDIPETISLIKWYAEAVDKQFGKVSPTNGDAMGLIVKEPIGVVGAVLPWNFPALMFAFKAGPALATGNSVIVKPAEQTSLSTYRMVELAHQAGIPESALLMVTGHGEDTGQPLGLHNDIDMISFTGSTEVGRKFLEYSAQSNLKEIVLECGGKSPQIVFSDIPDMDAFIDDMLNAAFWNMGENCSCGSRLIVERTIRDQIIEKMITKMRDWKMGDPTQADTIVGPMIEQKHFDKVKSYLDKAKSEGAQLVYGGTASDEVGLFVEPTIFSDVTAEMSIFKEEIFGPILAVTAFDTEEEALKLANDTDYGLAASIYTSDIYRAQRAAAAVNAGTISINGFSEGDISTPFGGFKQSGFGGKDNGVEAFDQYQQTKTIWYVNK
ncbi:gamma-glutamyl-gamma-aminobutyraldehyde dehydrogenase [Vibrio tasmaniensis ZS-17]|uniref:aldehyde dehydrogenase n=1 Tax=Vibrio tasmaniensis TaxID=212663 RepID=UPI0002FFE9F1|nr:aldehyde dehydrogenase [Vibrio tasmaniensis]OED62043.1 gamma-glutamyl-gamma-aminobutyraldehyde dehydrogenase [Vibrio tasmaniensis ZS-17]